MSCWVMRVNIGLEAEGLHTNPGAWIKLRLSNYASATKTHPLWQVHAKSHLTRHMKIPPPLASTCKVTSYTSHENPTPSGKYMHSHILHVIWKSHPLWQVHAQSHLTRHMKIPPPLASTCKVTSYTWYENPTPSGKYMHSHILHVIWKSHPLWQVHAQSHLTRHMKIPPPLASTCTVTSYTSYENPTPSGKYMHSHILHVTWTSHPLWQVHAKSHLTRPMKIPPPLASTCTVTSCTSYQNPTASGKYIQSHILHVISKSHPVWQVHAQSHLTRHIKIPPPLASTCTVTCQGGWDFLYDVKDVSATTSGKYMHSHILHVIWKSHLLWQVHAQSYLTRHIKIPPRQVHAQSHLTRHMKIPPALASTCTVTSYTSYENPTPSGKYMQVTSYTSYENPTPSGKHMHSHILHVLWKSHPLWQVHAKSHLTRHMKIPPPLASTFKVTSYTSYQNPTPSGKYMQSHILHVIRKSHPLWEVHAQSHLTRHIKIPPPLASTCTVTSYTSYENPTPSGKYMHSHILHVTWKSHPLWQVHAQSHLTGHVKFHPFWQVHAKSHPTRHMKIPPPLASTCKVTSYTSYENPTPSGKYMHSHILHVIWKSHPSGKYMHSHILHVISHFMHSHILHVISKSHRLWQVHAKSHLTRDTKIPPPLGGTCTVTSYTSYQNPTPSGKYMHSHILHVIWKSHPLWQVHAQSHLTRHMKIPPPLASTCTVTSYRSCEVSPLLASTCKVTSHTSYENSTPSGKYMQSHILHVIWKSHPLWQVHAQSHLTRHMKIPPLWQVHAQSHLTRHMKIPPLWQVHAQSHLTRHLAFYAQSHLTRHMKIPPPLASTFQVTSKKKVTSYILFLNHSLRSIQYGSWFTKHCLRVIVSESWLTKHSLRIIVYESWFTNHGLRVMVYRSRSQPWSMP